MLWVSLIWTFNFYLNPAHHTVVRFQDPKTEEPLELDSIGSEMSCEGFKKITETHVKLETKYSEEALNTGNAELQEPNAKPDLENIKKKIRTEPGKNLLT